MALSNLFSQIMGAVTQHTEQQNQSPNTPFEPGGLMGSIQGLFGQHAQETGQQLDYGQYNQGGYGGGQQGGILPASQDPYGDPADQQGGGILPASQDPYGDPADRR